MKFFQKPDFEELEGILEDIDDAKKARDLSKSGRHNENVESEVQLRGIIKIVLICILLQLYLIKNY